MAWFRHAMCLNYGYFVDHNFPAWVLNLLSSISIYFSPFCPESSNFYEVKSAGASPWPCWAYPPPQGSLQREQNWSAGCNLLCSADWHRQNAAQRESSISICLQKGESRTGREHFAGLQLLLRPPCFPSQSILGLEVLGMQELTLDPQTLLAWCFLWCCPSSPPTI